MVTYIGYRCGVGTLVCKVVKACPKKVALLIAKVKRALSLPKQYRTITHKALKVMFYSLFTRYVVQRLVMLPFYPAQSFFLKFLPHFRSGNLDRIRENTKKELTSKGYLCKELFLEENGIKYNGMIISHPDTINNGKWVLQATGNAVPIEHVAEQMIDIYCKGNNPVNVLLVNGPGVGKSEGAATPATMGAAQRLGIRFLEERVKAKRIGLVGHSLGGAAIAQAILQHEFKRNIKYCAIFQMTFDRASNIASQLVSNGLFDWGVKKLIQIVGCEMDSVAAVRKLKDLGIPLYIAQLTSDPLSSPVVANDFVSDGVIPRHASLAATVIEEGVISDQNRFIGLNNYNVIYPEHPHNHMAMWHTTAEKICNWCKDEEVLLPKLPMADV